MGFILCAQTRFLLDVMTHREDDDSVHGSTKELVWVHIE